MSSVAIRPAKPADLRPIAAIYAHAVRHGTASFEIEPPDEAEMGRRYGEILAGGCPYLAAELDGGLAGFAYAGPFRLRAGYRWTVEDSVYVAPSAQGRGVGRALLGRLIVECETRGYRQMIAVIGDSGNAASIAVHQGRGFRAVGTLNAVGLKFGRWLDVALMQRGLGEGARTIPREEARRSTT